MRHLYTIINNDNDHGNFDLVLQASSFNISVARYGILGI